MLKFLAHRFGLAALALLLGLTDPLKAEESAVSAVGVISFEGRSDICTGTLIAPQIVLTAAHCLYRSGVGWYEARLISFLPEGDAGRAVVAVKSVLHPEYAGVAADGLRRIAVDLAVIKLDMPVSDATPLAVMPLQPGPVTLAHFSNSSRRHMTMQENCPVLRADDKVVVIGCDVRAGASGSPVLTPYGVGAVVVARSNGGNEAWAVVPGDQLAAMVAEVNR